MKRSFEADIKELVCYTQNEEKIIKFVQAGETLTLGSMLKRLETFYYQTGNAVPLQDCDVILKAILCRDPRQEARYILSLSQCSNLVYVTANRPDITRTQRRDAVKSVKLLRTRAPV